MKVVIVRNDKVYSLSKRAVDEIISMKGLEKEFEAKARRKGWSEEWLELAKKSYCEHLDRHDEVLVFVVERLGKEAAGGTNPELEVVEIPGKYYLIVEDKRAKMERLITPSSLRWTNDYIGSISLTVADYGEDLFYY
jgi:hypothetical protein